MRISVLLLIIFVFVQLQAQNYQISFAGTGASSNVDSVKVENLTQCTSISLKGSDILNLNGVNGINTLDPGEESYIDVYPNPVTDYCLIEFEATAQGEATLELYDAAGRKITCIQDFLIKGDHLYSLSGLGTGIYFLKIKSNQFSYSAKILSSNSNSGNIELKRIEAAPNINKGSSVIKIAGLKSLTPEKSLINMQYTPGNTLKLTGISGIYSTVYIIVPTKSQTVTFDFIACTDGDNNNYTVVQIGTDIWMEENLKTTKYNDGTSIPLVTDTTKWIKLTTPAYCWDNNDITYKNIYGGLYNWYAVSTGKLCPSGWHVLTDTNWTTLTNNLGGEGVAGGAIKETCSALWISPNTGATNSSGFTALPAGNRRYSDGLFYSMGSISLFWSSTMHDASTVYDYELSNISSEAIEAWTGSITNGFSVRCVKD